MTNDLCCLINGKAICTRCGLIWCNDCHTARNISIPKRTFGVCPRAPKKTNLCDDGHYSARIEHLTRRELHRLHKLGVK